MLQSKPMNYKAVCDYLSISKATLNRYQKMGYLPKADYAIGGNKKRLWKPEAIEIFLANQAVRNIEK